MSKTFTTCLKCEVLVEGDKPIVQTARGRLSYPNLFEAKAGGEDGSTLKYSTTLVFPANVDLTALKEACYAVAAKKWGESWQKKFPKLPMPWKASDSENKNGIPRSTKIGVDPKEFPTLINAGSQEDFGQPGIVDHKTVPVTDKSQVYPGRWAMITVQPFAYERSSNRGISLGLQNVMLLENDEPLAAARRSAQSEFKPVEISESADALFKDDAA